MKRKHMFLILTLIGLSSFTLYGCTSKEKPSAKEAEIEESLTEETPVTKEPAPTKAEEADPAPKDPNQTPIEEIQGEGMTDTTLPDLDTAVSVVLEEEYLLTDASGQDYGTITITNVSVTDERDGNNISNPEKLVLIDYTYENLGSDPLLFDDMSFKLVVDNAVCTPYYASFLIPADLIGEGESCSAQIAYEVPSASKEGTLVFTNALTSEEISFDAEF